MDQIFVLVGEIMINLIFFRSPWPVKAVLAALCFGLAWFAYQFGLENEAEKAQALRDGVPEAVSLNEFDPVRDIHAADEVHVIGWVNSDFNYTLTETRKTKRSKHDVTRRMFVMLGPDDSSESKTARAVILLPDYAVDRFFQEMVPNLQGFDGDRGLFRLSGTAESKPELKSMAEEALAKLGMKKGPGFQFIEPWSKAGRAADLAPNPDTMQTVTLIFAGLGGLLLLMALAGMRRRKTPAVAAQSHPIAHLDTAIGVDPARAAAAKPTPSDPKPKLQLTFMFLLLSGFLFLVGLFLGNFIYLGLGALGVVFYLVSRGIFTFKQILRGVLRPILPA